MAVEGAGFGGEGLRPPGFFGESDAVLAGDRAVPSEDLAEEFVQGGVGFF